YDLLTPTRESMTITPGGHRVTALRSCYETAVAGPARRTGPLTCPDVVASFPTCRLAVVRRRSPSATAVAWDRMQAEVTMIELTPEQVRALAQAGSPLTVLDPSTRKTYT